MEKRNRIQILDAILLVIVWMIIWWWIMLWKQEIILHHFFNDYEIKFSKIASIDKLLKSEYFDQELLENSTDDMVEWALAGYVWALNDPYTAYLREEENEDLTNELEDNAGFAWIWAVIEKQDNYAVISEVLKWSPAARAGLLPTDKIYMVDEKSLEELNVKEVAWLIRWEKWTEVNLFIQRDGKQWEEWSKFWIWINRDDVNIPSVSWEVFEKEWKNLLYLEVSIISSHTTSLLLSEIREAIDEVWKIDWIILDIRWNSWWYLEEAIRFLWHFFPKNSVVAKSKYQAYDDIDHLSEWRWELWHYPIVILVDQLTASAWEIIALTFQESWTPIIWMQTFGKGSIQTIMDFRDWASLKYTVWKWYSPKWVSIDKEWITPDIEVERDYEKYKEDWTDNQLETAKEELLKLIE